MTSWRQVLPELIQEQSFRTQSAIVTALGKAVGEQINQGTVSRELTTLGARKIGGVYRLPSSRRAGANIYGIDVTAGGCLMVVHTDSAFATVVSNLIDRSKTHGVLGTIAGDDTVFVATSGEAVLGPLADVLGWSPGEERRRRRS